VTDDDQIRFHNGDTLDSIPVVPPTVPLPPGLKRLPYDPEVFPPRPLPARVTPVVASIITGAAVMGALVGMVVAWASRNEAPVAQPPASPVPSVVVSTVAPEPPSPAPTVTVQTAPTETEEPEAAWEDVMIVAAPSTGGDPSTDYCLAYTYDGTNSLITAALLANAPAWQCDDYLFSTHPSDMEGVWEETPPDCTATPGGRTVRVAFDAMTDWSNTVLYSCVLAAQ